MLGMFLITSGEAMAEEAPPDPSLLPLLQQMVQEDPQAADTWRLIGRIHRSQGRQEQALDSYLQALTIQDDNAAAHFDLGQLLVELGNSEAAQTHFQMVMRYAPQSKYADQLVDAGFVQSPSGNAVANAGFEITGDEQPRIEQTAYEIQTFDGADDLDRRLNELDLESPEVVKDFQLYVEFGTLCNTNVSLTPISRELRSSNAASAQAFLNPDLQWTAIRNGTWRAGPRARGAFNVNESHQSGLNLASFQPGMFIEMDMPDLGQNQVIGRVDYVYSIDTLGGSRFGDRHSVTASATLISPEADVLYFYLMGSLSDFNNDGAVPAVNSLDGTSLTTGVSQFFSTDLVYLPTWSIGADLEFADTEGADYRYNSVNVHTNATIRLRENLDFIPSAGVGYRDYYDFTGSQSRDELTWRVHGKLKWQCTEHWAISGVAGYDRFATDNVNFDSERVEGGVVFTYSY